MSFVCTCVPVLCVCVVRVCVCVCVSVCVGAHIRTRVRVHCLDFMHGIVFFFFLKCFAYGFCSSQGCFFVLCCLSFYGMRVLLAMIDLGY